MKKYLHFILDVIFNYTFYRCGRSSGVERNLAKVDVEGSNPFTRSNSSLPLREVFSYIRGWRFNLRRRLDFNGRD